MRRLGTTASLSTRFPTVLLRPQRTGADVDANHAVGVRKNTGARYLTLLSGESKANRQTQIRCYLERPVPEYSVLTRFVLFSLPMSPRVGQSSQLGS
jgi:hypothetical protein